MNANRFLRQVLANWPLLTFSVAYCAVILFCRSAYYRDPTSVFFQPEVAYRAPYTSIRRRRADYFIDQVAIKTFRRIAYSPAPNLCLGIKTVTREGARYFRTTVGSLLEGLNDNERQEIIFIALIAQVNPELHPASQERWLYNVADKILEYPESDVDRIRKMEADPGLFRGKELFDHVHLLKACAETGAPYVLMAEDDVVASDGWYQKTKDALKAAEIQTHEKGRLDFLYLRLFYTEKYLGWNSEEWRIYLFWSLIAVFVPALILSFIRQYSSRATRIISSTSVFVISFICIPMCIALFFAAGRVSMLPLSEGVNEMPKFGCCSQSMVFPQSRIAELINFYDAKKIGFVDTLTEEFADEHDELRWALTPSIMQHIGAKSSKDGAGNMKQQTIWNFAFEGKEQHL